MVQENGDTSEHYKHTKKEREKGRKEEVKKQKRCSIHSLGGAHNKVK